MKAYQVKRNSKRQNYDTDTPHPHPLLPPTVIKETHCGLGLLCNTAGHQRKQSVPHTDLSQGYSPWIELLPLDLQTCLSQSYSPWIELLPFDLKLQSRVILLGQSYFSLIIKLSWPELPFLERVTVFRSFLPFFSLRFGSPQLIDWFSTLPIRVVQQCIMGMLLVPDRDQSHCRIKSSASIGQKLIWSYNIKYPSQMTHVVKITCAFINRPDATQILSPYHTVFVLLLL